MRGPFQRATFRNRLCGFFFKAARLTRGRRFCARPPLQVKKTIFEEAEAVAEKEKVRKAGVKARQEQEAAQEAALEKKRLARLDAQASGKSAGKSKPKKAADKVGMPVATAMKAIDWDQVGEARIPLNPPPPSPLPFPAFLNEPRAQWTHQLGGGGEGDGPANTGDTARRFALAAAAPLSDVNVCAAAAAASLRLLCLSHSNRR